MVWKLVSAAVFAVAAGVGAVSAQSANDFSGPRELPPASFKGQQYTDSRGCVFLRAGLSGKVTWVPRVSADRKQLCGYPPTFGKPKIEVVEDVPKSAPAPQPAGRKPIETVATTTAPPRIKQAPPKTSARVPASIYAAPPVVMAQPAKPVAVAPKPVVVAAPKPATPAPVAPKVVVRQAKAQPSNGCYADAPVRETFEVRGGGTITLCTPGNGSLADARPPRLAGGAAAVAASGFVETPRVGASGKVVLSSQDVTVPPKGYKKAWQDDRLNTRRGQGTAEGWAEQDQVWTRDIPAQSVEAARKAGKTVIVVRRVSVSSKSSPVEPAAKTNRKAPAGSSYVQIGMFGVPANADGAASRLRSIGLPVARAKTTKSGKALQIVFAGPFGSQAEAQAALAKVRGAGFRDAILR